MAAMRLSRYGIVLESLSSDHLKWCGFVKPRFVQCNMEFKELLSQDGTVVLIIRSKQQSVLGYQNAIIIGLIHIKI